MIGIRVMTDGRYDAADFREPSTLKALQEAVGGYIEVVHPEGLPPHFCMVVNEEGRLLGLPINTRASLLFGEAIVGDAVILKAGINEDGDPDLVGLDVEDVGIVLSRFFGKRGGQV